MNPLPPEGEIPLPWLVPTVPYRAYKLDKSSIKNLITLLHSIVSKHFPQIVKVLSLDKHKLTI